MKLRSIKKRIVLHMVNHTLAGTRFFAAKRRLLRSIGYEIGDNTKIVGPIHNTGTLCIGADCWVGCNLTVSGNGTVTIGDNCDIAPDVTFLTGGHRIGSHARRAGEGETYRISVGNGLDRRARDCFEQYRHRGRKRHCRLRLRSQGRAGRHDGRRRPCQSDKGA